MGTDLTSIDTWEISQRLATILKKANCNTVHDVVRLGRNYFTRTPSCGPVTLHELDAALKRVRHPWLVSLPVVPVASPSVRVRILVAVDSGGNESVGRSRNDLWLGGMRGQVRT